MDVLPVEWLTLNSVYTLRSAITALRTSQEGHQDDSGGPVCQLPEGAELEVCGGGFNKRTVKSRYGDCYYHVFWRDLASAGEQMGLLRLAEMVKDQDQVKAVEVSGGAYTNRE